MLLLRSQSQKFYLLMFVFKAEELLTLMMRRISDDDKDDCNNSNNSNNNNNNENEVSEEETYEPIKPISKISNPTTVQYENSRSLLVQYWSILLSLQVSDTRQVFNAPVIYPKSIASLSICYYIPLNEDIFLLQYFVIANHLLNTGFFIVPVICYSKYRSFCRFSTLLLQASDWVHFFCCFSNLFLQASDCVQVVFVVSVICYYKPLTEYRFFCCFSNLLLQASDWVQVFCCFSNLLLQASDCVQVVFVVLVICYYKPLTAYRFAGDRFGSWDGCSTCLFDYDCSYSCTLNGQCGEPPGQYSFKIV